MGPQDIDVVILNYQTAPLAIEAARSARDNGATSIVVVDNHSGDDSLSILQREIGAFTRILPMPGNYGFSAGNNRGAKHGNRPLVLFMNADARLQDASLTAMAKVYELDPRIGAVGPALFYPDGRPQASAYFFITPMRVVKSLLGIDKIGKKIGWAALSGNIDPDRNGNYSGPVESLYGPCFLARRKAFEEVGGFDETFFLYCEETDFIFRLAEKGWKAYRVSEAKVTHIHGESANQVPVSSLVSMQESLWIYAKKHFRVWGKLLTVVASVIGYGFRFLLSQKNTNRKRYRAALGVWLGWTSSADPRKHILFEVE